MTEINVPDEAAGTYPVNSAWGEFLGTITAIGLILLALLTLFLFTTYSRINSSECWKTGEFLAIPTFECHEEY